MKPQRSRIEALERHIERRERVRIVMYDAEAVPTDPAERAAYFESLTPPGATKVYLMPRNGRDDRK